MVERVEDEIMMAMNGDPKGGSFSRAAYAAIEAMREPTNPMLDAACSVGPDTNHGPFDYDSARAVYRAMISAALSEVEG